MGQQRCLDSNCFGSFQPQNSNGLAFLAQQEQPVLLPHEENRAFDLKLFFNSCIFFSVIALHGLCLYNIENQ
ncbi:hypothetical protein E2320_001360 [Naja naja]|nr:hypothetical protein E2320_001360 [Naja naja]